MSGRRETDFVGALTRRRTLLGWGTGAACLALAGWMLLAGATPTGQVLLAAILSGGCAAMAIPPLRHRILALGGMELNRGTLVLLITLGLLTSMVLVSIDLSEEPDPTGAEEDPIGVGSPTDVANVEESITRDRDGNVTMLYAHTHPDDGGFAVGVSEHGAIIAYGLQDGDLLVYDEHGTVQRVTFWLDRDVSHLTVSEEERRLHVAWLGASVFAVSDLDGGSEAMFGFSDLWDVDATPNMETLVAVSHPGGARGSVGYRSGDDVWTRELPDSVGESVRVSDDGQYVVVAAAAYLDDSGPRGWTGVKVYDSDGAVIWKHETAASVLAADVDVASGRVVAGTVDGRLLVFDLEGDLLWEDPSRGGWVHLSQQGETIVTPALGVTAGIHSDGDVRWEATVAPSIGMDVFVSADGTRALVVDRSAGDAYLLDDGDVVWESAWPGSPIMGDLSADGTTWAIIVQDPTEDHIHVYAFRDDSK